MERVRDSPLFFLHVYSKWAGPCIVFLFFWWMWGGGGGVVAASTSPRVHVPGYTQNSGFDFKQFNFLCRLRKISMSNFCDPYMKLTFLRLDRESPPNPAISALGYPVLRLCCNPVVAILYLFLTISINEKSYLPHRYLIECKNYRDWSY